ncbi:MAG: phosphoglycerate kinase [Gemmatimonadota bacterium]|nr:phosphoglycerate kinase [Gemmatimonadota bacterium]
MAKSLHDLLQSGLRAGATVALRADFNVPLASGRVADAVRVERTVPSIVQLLDARARVVLLSHLGRPGGRIVPELSLRPVSRFLAGCLRAPVRFIPHTAGAAVREAVAEMPQGSVSLVENTRFLPGETGNDPALAADWARWSDHYVLDAFGTAHRAHASTDGLPRAVRAKGGEAVAGGLVERELAVLAQVLERPGRPHVAILGGAKISGKIHVIEALLPKVDVLLVGGAMANTFFMAMGMRTGASLVEAGASGTASRLLVEAGSRLVLPVDCVVAKSTEPGAHTRVVDRGGICPDDIVVDIGPTTVRLFQDYISRASTVVWNGPMGLFEVAGFEGGTFGIARAAADVADSGATVIVGGGDSAAAARAAGVAPRLGHISTGGGACLDLLAGKALPGIEALSGRSDHGGRT